MAVRVGSKDPPARLVSGVSRNIMPEWSPAGEWIAAVDTAHVILVSPDGRAKRTLRCDPGPLAWSPDGRTLYVVRHGVRAIDVRTGNDHIVRDLVGVGTPIGLMTPGDRRVSVTADGKALVYSVITGNNTLWLLDGVRTPKPWYARLW